MYTYHMGKQCITVMNRDVDCQSMDPIVGQYQCMPVPGHGPPPWKADGSALWQATTCGTRSHVGQDLTNHMRDKTSQTRCSCLSLNWGVPVTQTMRRTGQHHHSARSWCSMMNKASSSTSVCLDLHVYIDIWDTVPSLVVSLSRAFGCSTSASGAAGARCWCSTGGEVQLGVPAPLALLCGGC